MKWSATMTTRAGSKTFLAPICSIARKATGPETSFAMTRSQRTITRSPGAMSSASVWASRIFSASVCGMEPSLRTSEPGSEFPRIDRSFQTHARLRHRLRCLQGKRRCRLGGKAVSVPRVLKAAPSSGAKGTSPVDLALELAAEDALEPRGDGDQRLQVDSGLDALAVQEVHEILRRDVAGGARRERAAADPADG